MSFRAASSAPKFGLYSLDTPVAAIGNSMAEEPDNLVLVLLRSMRADMADMKSTMATKDDLAEAKAELRSEMRSLRADVASDLATMQAKADAEHRRTRKEVGEQVAGLRQAVVEYHAAVVGHGVLIGELDERVRRVERHLELPTADAH